MHDLFALSGFDDFSGRMPVKKKKPMTKAIKKGTAIYYTNNDVTKLIMKKENVKLEGNQQQKVKILLKKLQQTPKSNKIRSVIPKRIMINGVSVNTNIVEIDFFDRV